MFCSRCGKQIDDARFCPKCGHEVGGHAPVQTAPDSTDAAAASDTEHHDERLQTIGDQATIGAPRSPDGPSLLEPGQTFAGRYEIRGLLGRGGMGAVYEAHDTVLKEPVALKILLPELTQSEKATERLLRETRISRRLTHKNIVRVHDVLPAESADGLSCISMERIEGSSLRGYIETHRRKQKPVSVKHVLSLARQICEAMEYAHATTVHRDLKPDNILLARDGTVKISDFGIACLVHRTGVQATSVAGTMYYMAPEQTQRGAEVDRRADVYSLGVILYEALVGQVPMGRFRTPREIRDDVPEHVDQAIMAALDADPEHRPSSMREFYGRLSGKTSKEIGRSATSATGRSTPPSIRKKPRQARAASAGSQSGRVRRAARSAQSGPPEDGGKTPHVTVRRFLIGAVILIAFAGTLLVVLINQDSNQKPRAPTTYTVAGTVYLDGKPLAGARVQFYSLQERETNADGVKQAAIFGQRPASPRRRHGQAGLTYTQEGRVYPDAQATTESDGSYRVQLPSGRYSVEVVHPSGRTLQDRFQGQSVTEVRRNRSDLDFSYSTTEG